jgi:hypothetical protein
MMHDRMKLDYNNLTRLIMDAVSENSHENPLHMRLSAMSYNTADIQSMKMDSVQTGVWLPENDRPASFRWVCSICKRIAYDMPVSRLGQHSRGSCGLEFCPHCGKPMRNRETKA